MNILCCINKKYFKNLCLVIFSLVKKNKDSYINLYIGSGNFTNIKDKYECVTKEQVKPKKWPRETMNLMKKYITLKN